MIVGDSVERLRSGLRAPVATIGNFDGVHRGHHAILARVLERARVTGGNSLVITFEPHPLKVLMPDRAPRLIVTRRQKLALLEAAGVDAVLVLPFDVRLASLSAGTFVADHLAKGLALREAYVGGNFNFGRGREGDATTLIDLCARHGILAGQVPEVTFLGSPVSSSRIRRAVLSGEVELAGALLGRAYEIEGMIERGAGRGASIGIPTANLLPDNELIPQEGVYVTRALIDRATWPAVTNVGVRPTFGGAGVTIETHVLDTGPNLYGRRVEIAFLARLRAELRFDSAQALVEQIHRDIDRARAWFADDTRAGGPAGGEGPGGGTASS